MSNGERMIPTSGAEICAESFGDSRDPAILLIHGACASMLWWESDLCQAIADRGRFVIRYDNRDTGRSTNWPPGLPGYSLNDMVLDAVALLDAFRIGRAHIVGRSMSGAIALALGVDHPERVLSLVFATTTTGDDDLPEMSDAVMSYTSSDPDFSSSDGIARYVVGLMRVFAGGSDHFDEDATRALAVQDIARTINIQSTLTNHFCIDFDAPRNGGFADIAVPALVVHGEIDPVYPLPHGEALRGTMKGARLLVLPGAGHEIPRGLWALFVDGLIAHTNRPVGGDADAFNSTCRKKTPLSPKH